MASRSLGTLTLDLIARIGGFQQGMDRASRSVASTGAAADAASARINALQGQFLSLSSVASKIAGPLAAAFSLNSVYQATEAYSTLTNRLKLVTNGSAELAEAQKAVFDIAQASAQPLSSTAELYQRIANNQDALKLSGKEVAGIVGTISKTLAISGASAESANAALVQLGQAFARGTLRGEELNSVLEQAPALAQAIAKGMGRTVGELSAMGAAGELTSQVVVKAIQAQSGAVDTLFAKTATTIGNSFTKISNSMTRFVGELDQATGASARVSAEFVGLSKAIDGSLPGALSSLRSNSEALTQVMTTGLYVALGRIAGGFAQQGAQALYAAASNQTLLTATARTAKGDLYAAQAKQIDAKALLQRANLEITAAEGKVASDRVRQGSELANIKTVQASLAAERLLEQQRLAAQITETGRAASISRLAEIRLAEVAVIKKVELAERSLATTTVATSIEIQAAYARRTAAALAYGETTAAANAAAIASDRAAAAASVAGRAFGVMAAAGRGLLALLGGPVGLLFVAGAVTLSFADFRSSAEKAAQGLEGLKGPLDDVIAKFQQLTRDQKAAALIRWGEAEAEAIKATSEEYEKFQKTLKTGLVGPRSSASGTAIFLEYSKRIGEATAAGKDLSPILDELRSNGLVDPKVVDSLVKRSGALSELGKAQSEARERLTALNGEMNKGVSTTSASTQATTGMTAAGSAYLKTLQTQLGKLQDNNDAVKEASRYISEHKDLSEADKTAIMSAAYASKSQAEANKASTKETQANTSAIKANLKTFEDAEENYKRQIALIDETSGKKQKATEVEKLAFEIASGNYAKLSEGRKKELEGLAADLDAKKALVKANQDAAKLDALGYNLKESNQTAKDGFAQELAGAGEGDKYKSRLKEFLAIDQDFNKQRREMYKEYKDATLAGDPDAQENYDKETALLEEALAERIVIQQDYYNQLDEAQSNWMDGVSNAWQNFVDAATDYSAMAAEATSSVLGSAKSGLSTFLADVISGAEDADDALGDLIANFAKSTLQALTDMAAQWLVYQAVQLLVGKTTQASAVPSLVANAQATAFQASLAAYASTAAIPIVGPAAAPLAAATAAAATAPMVAGVASAALAGMAHDGMGSIPKEGTWLLDGGERVVAPAQNKDLTNFLARQTAATESVGTERAGGGGININAPVTVQAQPGMSGEDARKQGEAMGQGLASEVRRVLQLEMGQGGLLWRRV
ncbi:tape measure protein [Pseudomonas sp. MAFF 730085]|uniref:Tape measure protein n=1 Tax=Pseudomonas kitaguniensis TaxID=2607908 RepID=A0A5N7JTD0_9PSED|nr:tape measure protein [Pseudomonas kitaguniensis]MPQ84483.1 tape measure protein [Pseudomonas kitaguniensis]